MGQPERPMRPRRDPWHDDTLGRTLRAGFVRPSVATPSDDVWRRIERGIEPRRRTVADTRVDGVGWAARFRAPTASLAASIGALAVGLMLGTMSLGVILSGNRADVGMRYEPVLVAGLSRAEAEIQQQFAPSAIDRTSPAGFGPMRWVYQWHIEQRIRMADGPFEPRCEAFNLSVCGDDLTTSTSARGDGAIQDFARPDMIAPRPAVRF